MRRRLGDDSRWVIMLALSILAGFGARLMPADTGWTLIAVPLAFVAWLFAPEIARPVRDRIARRRRTAA